MELDKNSCIPLYHQLKNKLLEMIENNYNVGDALPTETELEKMFNVSRMTVRLAVNALVEEELLEKQQGRGTFVKKPKITHDLMTITSWTDDMIKRGLTPKTVDTAISLITPPKKIRQLLKLNNESKVVKIKRIRYANDEPMCIMTNYLVESYVPDLAEEGLKYESLYKTISEKYRISFTLTEETVEAREATEYESEVLMIEEWSPVLVVTTVSYNSDGTPIEVVNIVSRADRYQYRNTIHASVD
ncbi:MAG TPA: GntR family transcriptional regulator [Clostridia bacterium]|nr:GntR family transcriptional regulator [Clostridia bacterium]